MKRRFSPKKGFNTRKHLTADAPYVKLLCQKMHTKIAAEWAEKWQPLGLGDSLEDCRNIRCFSTFIKALSRDIIDTYNLQGHNEKVGIAESSLKRLLDVNRLPDFLQKHTRDMLMVYLGFQSWDAFKQAQKDEISEPVPLEALSSQFHTKTRQVVYYSYTGSVNNHRSFRLISFTLN